MAKTGSKPTGNGQSDGVTAVQGKLRVRRPFPAFSLEQTLVVAQGIADENAGKPYSRLSLADAVHRKPDSSGFRDLLSASISYGLTEGSQKAPQVKLTPLGVAAVLPKDDGERRAALIRAARNIPLFDELYTKFDQAKLPAQQNFRNTLVREHNVEALVADAAIEQFRADGKFTGLIRFVGGAERVDITNSETLTPAIEIEDEEISPSAPQAPPPSSIQSSPVAPTNNRVFISHGKNHQIRAQLKDLLTFGSFEPVIAEERETTAQPVPDKVLTEMRRCSAAVIHVESERKLLDDGGAVHHVLNENVLIEIGAAMALYNRSFILLVQKGVQLPTNLQGLYRCEYEGDRLDYDATMKLLKAFTGFKSNPRA